MYYYINYRDIGSADYGCGIYADKTSFLKPSIYDGVTEKLHGFTVKINHPRANETIALVVHALMKKDYKDAGKLVDKVAEGCDKLEEEYATNGRGDQKLFAIVTQEKDLVKTLQKLFMDTIATEIQKVTRI